MTLPTVCSKAIDPLHPRDGELSSTESEQLSSRASSRRRADFAAGRLAVYAASTSHFGQRMAALPRTSPPHQDSLDLFEFVDGEPTVPFAKGYVSVSHQGRLAVAAVFHRPVGVDLVERGSVTLDLVTTLFSATEVTAWQNELKPLGAADVARDVAFAAKEAFLKILGEGLRVEPTAFELFAEIDPATSTSFDPVRTDGSSNADKATSYVELPRVEVVWKPSDRGFSSVGDLPDPKDLKPRRPLPMEFPTLAGRLSTRPNRLIEVLLWEKESKPRV